MQHYIYYGYGFNTKLLKNENITELLKSERHTEDVLARLIPYTEDYEGIEWSTFVIFELGELPNFGKMASLSELDNLISKNKFIKKEIKEQFKKEMERVGLFHLYDKIELVIYSTLV